MPHFRGQISHDASLASSRFARFFNSPEWYRAMYGGSAVFISINSSFFRFLLGSPFLAYQSLARRIGLYLLPIERRISFAKEALFLFSSSFEEYTLI
jgi:hypothetical protein